MMMMAFLIDQIQQMSCWIFKEAKTKAGSKRYLWECVRSYFRIYQVDSMETIYRAIGLGHERRQLKEVLQISPLIFVHIVKDQSLVLLIEQG
jgi:hypothetical protein